MGKNCFVCKLVGLLAGVGALNWGLVTLFDFNLVTKLLGDGTTGAKAVYVVVGLAGLMTLIGLIKCCPCCKKGECKN